MFLIKRISVVIAAGEKGVIDMPILRFKESPGCPRQNCASPDTFTSRGRHLYSQKPKLIALCARNDNKSRQNEHRQKPAMISHVWGFIS